MLEKEIAGQPGGCLVVWSSKTYKYTFLSINWLGISEFDWLFLSVYAFLYACRYMRAIYVYACISVF